MSESTISSDPAHTEPTVTDTSDMAKAHQLFRDALSWASELVGSASSRSDRVEYIATYYDNILRLLHAHHEAEDIVVWPPLNERAGAQAAEVARIADQHGDITPSLEEAESRLAAWRASQDAADGAAFGAALADLGATLLPHFDAEESFIVPLAAQHISPTEWAELPSQAMQRFTGDKVWLIVGLGLEPLPPEHLAMAEAHMPAPFAEWWTSTGRPEFDTFIKELRAY